MKESEATQKWCPVYNFNRPDSMDDGVPVNGTDEWKRGRCIAKKCMWWKLKNDMDKDSGYCGAVKS